MKVRSFPQGSRTAKALRYNWRCIVVLLDDRQITHLTCVRLRHLLYGFFRARLGPFI